MRESYLVIAHFVSQLDDGEHARCAFVELSQSVFRYGEQCFNLIITFPFYMYIRGQTRPTVLQIISNFSHNHNNHQHPPPPFRKSPSHRPCPKSTKSLSQL